MEHKRIPLDNVKPGWELTGYLRMVDGKWARIKVDAEGPLHANGKGESRRWRKAFGGADCENAARQYMQEHYGCDPFGASPSG